MRLALNKVALLVPLYGLLCLSPVLRVPVCMAHATSSKGDASDDDFDFEFGTLILTQNSLYDAPQRYNLTTYIDQAVDYVNKQQLPSKTIDPHTCKTYYICDAVNAKLRFSFQPGTLSLTLAAASAPGSVGSLKLQAGFYVDITKYKFILYHKSSVVGVCITDVLCKDYNMRLWGPLSTVVTADLFWNPSTYQLSVQVNPADITFNLHMAVDCSQSPGDVRDEVYRGIYAATEDAIREAITQVADSIISKINVPHHVEVGGGYSRRFQQNFTLAIDYKITNLTITPLTSAVASARGRFSVLFDHAPTLTYVDQNPVDASISPPITWSLSELTPDNILMITTTSVRLSSTVLEAMTWGLDVTGMLDQTFESVVFQANISSHLRWDRPITGITDVNTLFINMTGGLVEAQCNDVMHNNNITQILYLEFENLVGQGTVLYTSDPVPSLALNVSYFEMGSAIVQLKAPPMPIPTDMMNSLLRQLVNQSVPLINDMLKHNSMRIPDEIIQFVPNPRVTIVPQVVDVSQGLRHGYIELISFCSCGHAVKSWAPCNNVPLCTPSGYGSPDTVTVNDAKGIKDGIVVSN